MFFLGNSFPIKYTFFYKLNPLTDIFSVVVSFKNLFLHKFLIITFYGFQSMAPDREKSYILLDGTKLEKHTF